MLSPRLPPPVRDEVTAALEERLGRPTTVTGTRAVGGGCINPSARIEIEGGEAFFLKWNADHPELFGPEADGLKALAEAGGVGGSGDGSRLRIPEVLGVGRGSGGAPGWLLLEYVPEGSPGADYDRALAEGLSSIHAGGTSGPPETAEAWGWDADNFIGSLPQSNTPRPTWSEFWVEERIHPQLALARDRGFFDEGRRARSGWDELFERADELLSAGEEDGPSLLHGDLWSGNVYPGPRGEPVLIDPAVYRGHREVDLAMTELFGGFGSSFYQRYGEIRPLAPGYREVRRHLYQLYPLLVHVNLFGGGYAGRARDALERGLRAG
ncbi:MAG: fructosamine kinase family protein [Longimicrobiales bacterium]|nr:fructosamine kinase family protein [Longimicrobiales bacterium]